MIQNSEGPAAAGFFVFLHAWRYMRAWFEERMTKIGFLSENAGGKRRETAEEKKKA